MSPDSACWRCHKPGARRLENTRSADGQVRFLVYTLELASGLADREGAHGSRSAQSAGAPESEFDLHSTIKQLRGAGNGRTTWVIDFEGYSLRNAPSLKVGWLVSRWGIERVGARACPGEQGRPVSRVPQRLHPLGLCMTCMTSLHGCQRNCNASERHHLSLRHP